MSGGSSKSSNSNEYTTTNVSLEGENPVNIINSDGVEVQVVDHKAIANAFDFADSALASNERSLDKSLANASSAYKNASDMVSNQVTAIKDLATTLKVGDQNAARWMMFAALLAVVLFVIVYMIWG